MATVDVLLPVRNRLPYLREAIDSIRSQTFDDWRLLILDHGSDDGSAQLSYHYAELDKRIEVFCFPEADGIAELRNLGLAKCDCKYLFLQDADDVSLPNRFSIVLNRFGSDPEAFAVGGDAIIIDESGARIGYQRMPGSASAITAAGFFHNPIFHPAVAANFAALKRHDAGYGKDFLHWVRPTDSLSVPRLAEDYMLFGQLALLGRCLNLGVPLIKYRRHGGNSGNSAPLTQIGLSLQISRFLAKSFCVMKGLPEFDPGPLCNHAENVFDFGCGDYNDQFEKTARALRGGLGSSPELARELAFRWILATRSSSRMAARYLRFHLRYGATPTEMRTVRNWLLRGVRNGKYVYALRGNHE